MKHITDSELEELRPKPKYKWVQWDVIGQSGCSWKQQPFMFECLKCHNHYTYKECANCGNDEFRNDDGNGIFCSKCKKGFSEWVCENCSTENPVKPTFFILRNQGCYIATAVYGNHMASEVRCLLDFRDDFLLKSCIGKLFVGSYYRVSPFLARIIGSCRFLRYLTRILVVAPAVLIASKINTKKNKGHIK